MKKEKHRIISFSLSVFLAALTGFSSAETPQFVLDVINDAKKISNNGQAIAYTGGHRNYIFSPNNGYPGTEVTIKVAAKYQVVENGQPKNKHVNQVAIDWGDGHMSQGFPAFPITHKYGSRGSDGQINPQKNEVYQGKITIHTNDGNWYTENFIYRLWVDRQKSIMTGGRSLPHQIEEQVWCLNGERVGDTCITDFEFSRVIHQFEGCFDHGRFTIPVYDQFNQYGKRVFDTRGASIVSGRYSRGFQVAPNSGKNVIREQYPAYRVISTNNQSHDHMSGIYYFFNPLTPNDSEVSQPGMGEGEYRSQFFLDGATVRITQNKDDPSTRGSATINNYIYTQPSAANNWIATIQLNHHGGGGATPPCPYLHRANNNAWMNMLEITATYKGRIHVKQRPATSTSGAKLPSGWYQRGN